MNLRTMKKFKLSRKKKSGAKMTLNLRKLIRFKKIKKNCTLIFQKSLLKKVTVKLKI